MSEDKPTKRVLMFITHIRRGGGAEKIGVDIARGLQSRGHEVSLAVLQDFPNIYDFSGEYIVFDKEFKKSNPLKQFFYLFFWGYKLAKLCKKNKIDTVISIAKGPGLTSIISKFFGNKSKIITSVHNQPQQRISGIVRWLVKYLYRFADIVVAVSQGIEYELNKYFGLKNTITINNFVDEKKLIKFAKKPLSKAHKKIYQSGPTAINIGRLIHAKGQWSLVRAFSEVIDKLPEANLVILGEEKLRPKLESLIKKMNLTNSVHLLGNQGNPYNHLQHSDLFVLSSVTEGQPLTLLESAVLGKHIITTDCAPGIRDVVAPDLISDKEINYPHNGSCGILIEPPEDTEVWESAKEIPLTKPEKMLADQIIKIFFNNKDNNQGDCCNKRFYSDLAISRWGQII